jgi:hypothetical protein
MLSQSQVDKVRTRVVIACLISAVEQGKRKLPVQHLWFPEDRETKYELRAGNAPADSDRPRHLRRLHLAIDLGEIPPTVVDAVKAQRAEARKQTSDPTKIIDVVSNPRMVRAIMEAHGRGITPR